MRARHAVAVFAAAAAASLAAAAPATAGTVTTETRCLQSVKEGDLPCLVVAHFVAAPGEQNNLRVNVGSPIRFQDASSPIALESGICSREDEFTVTCPADEFDVRLGDGDDRFAHNPPYPPGSRGFYQRTVAYGEEGNDSFVGYATADVLDGGPGDDVFLADEGDDTIVPGPGADRIDGGRGVDVVDYSAEVTPVRVDLATGVTGGAAGGDTLLAVEDLKGGAATDELAGDAGPNRIEAGAGGGGIAGNGGDDVLTGGEGADTIDGGDGADVIAGAGRVDDLLFGGPGDDLIDTLAGGLVDAGEGDDRVRAGPPGTSLRVRCGAGDDAASVQPLVSLAADCEWLSFGVMRIEVHRALRLNGSSARARVRGFGDAGPPEAQGRLVLRDARTGRVLASARWRSRAATPGPLLFRPRLPRAAVRRLRAGRTLPVTVAEPGGPRGRATLAR